MKQYQSNTLERIKEQLMNRKNKIQEVNSMPPLEEASDGISNTTDLKSFYYLEDGSVTNSILNTKYTTKVLDNGVYDIWAENTNRGVEVFLSVNADKELFNEDLGFYYEDKIKNIYNKFFLPEIKNKVNLLGYNHKLGIILHGKQGTGKTTMFKKYFNDSVTTHNAIVFNVARPNYLSDWWGYIQKIRKIQSNPIIVFLDEFDELTSIRFDYEAQLKRILDGNDSIDNCFFMATTNYIEKIPDTIKNRPSRFKYKIEVKGIEDENLIRQFLTQSFNKIDMVVDFESELKNMKGWTIDDLKQWVLDKVMDIDSEVKTDNKIGFLT